MSEKNKYGQYFTISPIADFMVSLISHPKDCRVLEPSCGKGVFLEQLLNAGFRSLSAYEVDSTLETSYDFVKFTSFLSVPTTENYDVIIGNPPYIRWKNIEPELKQELENNTLWNRYFNSLCDYMYIFILKSIEHLTEDGELIFICTDYWMNTTHSVTLRNYMCNHGYFTEIYHFKEAPLFENVTASFVIFKFIKSRQRKDTIMLYKYNKAKRVPEKSELYSRSCFDEFSIPHFPENGRWILATREVQNELDRFEEACVKTDSRTLFEKELHRIGDYCDIGNGMVSGLDAAFQIKEIKELYPAERKVLINVMKAKDLGAYKNKGVTKYIFIQEEISTKDFENKYPHFAAHFKPYLKRLSKRYSYNRKIPYWEFVFPRNQKLFERDEAKIFIPCKERISNKDYVRFCYAPSGYYSTQDVTAVFRKADCRESLEYMLAYLNNSRVFNWLKLKGIVKGDIVEFSEDPIASIPFRPIDWELEKEVKVHNLITAEVKSYLKDAAANHLNHINNLFNTLFNE